MLSQIKLWLHTLKIKNSDHIVNGIDTSKMIDTQHHQSIKKLAYSHEMMSSLKPHASNCSIFDCQKDICFERTPDKIVSDLYTIDKKTKKKL
jgi:hypothetical protein